MKTTRMKYYLNKDVGIGVLNYTKNDGTLFFYYGFLRNVEPDSIVLETKQGLMEIDASQIKSFRVKDLWVR